MNIRNTLTRAFPAVMAAAALILSCSENNDNGNTVDESWSPVNNCAEWPISDVYPNRDSPDLGLENAIAVNFGGENPPGSEFYAIEADGDHIVVRFSSNVAVPHHNIVLSGITANGSLKVYGRNTIGLYMNGVNITNPNGPAINFQRGGSTRLVTVHLVGGCDRVNYLADGAIYDIPAGEDAKGTFFSEAGLIFTGSGSLEVRSRHRHAIVADNYIEIESGNIMIHESVSDGIHANDRIAVKGGTLQIKSHGDAIQNERQYMPIRFLGGETTLFTTGITSHGIASDSSDVIIGEGATLKITVTGNGSKGIRSRRGVEISGGVTDIKTSGNVHLQPPNERDPDDPDTTSNAAGIRAHTDFVMTNGTLTINSVGANSRGINVIGNVNISGGNVRVESISRAIDVDSDLTISGGTVYARSLASTAIRCRGERTVNVTITEINGSGGGF